MKKKLLGLAMAAATFGLVAQGSTANAFLLNDRSPNVQTGQIIAGLGMTAAYYGMICNNNFNHCARFTSQRALHAYTLTTVGCMALSPIIGGLLVSYNEHRELKSSEVLMMTADCVLPIIGGWIMKSVTDAHPEWDAGTGRRRN
jgi:H+/Cl- antiporter ClcA